MIQLKQLSSYRPGDAVRVILQISGGSSAGLPQRDQDNLAALALKPGSVEALRAVDGDKLTAALYALLPDKAAYDDLEEVTGDIIKQLKAQKAGAVDVLLASGFPDALLSALMKQLLLADDGFDLYRTSGIAPLDPAKEAERPDCFKPEFTLCLPEEHDLEKAQASLREAAALAGGIRTARRLVNEPANVMTPDRLAREARALAQEHGFEITVYDEQQIQQLGLEAFWSVAKGSDAPPRFLVMRYMNRPDSQQVLALVGKGLTYDSGGYSLKPADSMLTMFCDMGGAGAVISAMAVLADMKAPVNVVGIVAACENMISGHAYHNGDIIGSLSGKFIEVVNTDAEGRLTLADAITYAATVVKADKIIDIATLTGAVGVALGREITGVVCDDEGIYRALSLASEQSGDKIWRLPHYDFLAKANKSERADIKNSGGRPAGTATAALFCRAFACGVPWGHLDIAGTAYQDKPTSKGPQGATGVGVELLVRAAMHLFA
jgi:leucyl aminopeptidase